MKKNKKDKKDLNYKYWIKKLEECEEVVLTLQEISELNEKNYKENNSLFDLELYIKEQEKMNHGEIIRYIKKFYSYEYGAFYKEDGSLISKREHEGFISNMGMDWINANREEKLKFGIVSKRTNIRRYPSGVKGFKKNSKRYDRFVESSLYPLEFLCIIKESFDQRWLLVLCRDYIGWIDKRDVIVCTRESMIENIEKGKTIASMSDSNYAIIDGKRQPFLLGTQAKVKDVKGDKYRALFYDEEKQKVLIEIPGGQEIWEGYVPYTKRNLFKLAFQPLHNPYSWGGADEFRDCSQYTRDIYRCFGVQLKRNTSSQKNCLGAVQVDLTKMDEEEKRAMLAAKGIGGLLFLPGHVMMVLGKHEEEIYIIHASGGYYCEDKWNDGGVVVTPLDIESSGRKSYYEMIDTLLIIEKEE